MARRLLGRVLARIQRAGRFEPGGLELAEAESCWLVEGRVDLYELLRAIDETMPTDAVLYVEGAPAADVLSYLDRHAREPMDRIARGTIWPKPEVRHVPLRPGVLHGLRELAERHAEPEICDHLVVYRDGEVLLTAYDAGYSGVLVSRHLEPAQVTALRARLAR